MAVIVQPKWQTPERSITPESIFCARRNFIKTFGLCGLGLVAGIPFGCGPNENAAQIGAQENPLRLVVPWKYGFKSIKSIVKIEFTAEQPRTFWNSNRPHEYGFEANVDPTTRHPRWSQESAKLIDSGERRPTLLFNGYGEWVAALYS
jgi:hypothetical protein